MKLAKVTESGNISIPKEWRKELQIEPKSDIIMYRQGSKIILEPITQKTTNKPFAAIDEEMKKRKISFTTEEAIKDDWYD